MSVHSVELVWLVMDTSVELTQILMAFLMRSWRALKEIVLRYKKNILSGIL